MNISSQTMPYYSCTLWISSIKNTKNVAVIVTVKICDAWFQVKTIVLQQLPLNETFSRFSVSIQVIYFLCFFLVSPVNAPLIPLAMEFTPEKSPCHVYIIPSAAELMSKSMLRTRCQKEVQL